MLPGMKWLLTAAGFLVLLAGFQLFVLSDFTNLYFAWTIQPSLTAAFLGGGYFASAILEFLSSRKNHWGEGRIAVPAVFTFTTLTLLATLLHLNRFHFYSRLIFAQSAAWFWLAIYAIVPPVMLVMWVRQRRATGEDPERTFKLPRFLRAVLLAQGVASIAWGMGLFVSPAMFAGYWPWALTPLTSRAVGAWMVGVGILAAHSTIENDFVRVKVGMKSFVVFGILELAALIRYPTSFAWTSISGWSYLCLVISIIVVGAYSIWIRQRLT